MKQQDYHLKLMVSCPRNDSDMDIEVKGRYVDHGIGRYEYWGAKGVHHQYELEWELVSCPIPDEEVYNNNKLCTIIEEALEKHIEGVNQDAE